MMKFVIHCHSRGPMMPSCVGCDVKVVGTMGQVFAKRIAFLQERKELLLKRLGVERMERERVWAMLDEKVPQIASVRRNLAILDAANDH